MLIVVGLTAIVCSFLARSETLVGSQSRNALPPKDFKINECVDLLESLQENIEDSNQYQDGTNACSDMVRIHDIRCKCRHDTYVFLEWKADHEGHHHFPLNNITFLVEKWSYNYTQLNSTWTEHSWAKTKKYKIDGLSRNTEYKFRVTPYLNGIQIGQSTISDNVLTHLGNETLVQLRNVRVKQYSDQHGSVSALLTWDPPIDEVCVVTIIITEQGENGLDIKKAVADNTCQLDGLRYRGSYSVILYSSLNRAESEKVTHSFDTPSCSSLHNYDPMKCAPETPQNLKVEDWCTNFTITWDKPPVDPDYYFIMFTYDQYTQNFTVQGNETSLKFETGQFGANYFVYMTASNPSGSSKPNFVWNLSKCLELSRKQALMKEVTTKGLEVKRALSVPENLRLEGNCEPEIKWDKPSEDPLYYLVSVNFNNEKENFTISGNLTNFKLDKMSEGQLIIYLAAFSSDGELGQDSVSANVTCEEYLHQSTNVSGKYPVTTGNRMHPTSPQPQDMSIYRRRD